MPSFIHACILLFLYSLIYSLTFKLVSYSYNIISYNVITAWVQVLALSLYCCETLGRCPDFLGLHFLHLSHGGNSSPAFEGSVRNKWISTCRTLR